MNKNELSLKITVIKKYDVPDDLHDSEALKNATKLIKRSMINAINASLFSGISPNLFYRASRLEAETIIARDMLKYQWSLNDLQLEKRLVEIEVANGWDSCTAPLIWRYVLAGFEFNDSGQLKIEKFPYYK